MTAHLIAGPTTPVTIPDPATTAPGWLVLSAALTDEVPVIADREDLLVTVAPGAGHGAPACFLPAHATIEVYGTHLGSGNVCNPGEVVDRKLPAVDRRVVASHVSYNALGCAAVRSTTSASS